MNNKHINDLRKAFRIIVAAINLRNQVNSAFGKDTALTEFEILNILMYKELMRKTPRALIVESLLHKIEALGNKLKDPKPTFEKGGVKSGFATCDEPIIPIHPVHPQGVAPNL